MEKLKRVEVKWIDASDPPGESSWYSDEDVKEFAEFKVEITSLGYVKSDTPLYLTLVADYTENPNGTMTWGRPTKVPKGMITKVEEI